MTPTLLIVDGRGLPREQLRWLTARGYACLYARGPIRVRELLAEHTVDAILWKDNSANSGLRRDLIQEWEGPRPVPIIRLFGPEAGAAPDTLPSRVVTNLPAEIPVPELGAAIDRVIAETSAHGDPAARGELAFRHVVAGLRERAGRAERGGEASARLTSEATTGLRPAEREVLQEGAGATGSPSPATLGRFSRWLPWRWGRQQPDRPPAGQDPARVL
jgi:hypothetical protein